MSGSVGTAWEVREAVRSGATSASDVVGLSLGRVDDANGELNALTQVFHDRAIEQARAIDTRVASGDGGGLALAGVPVAIKDNICLSWGRTTAGSRMLERYRSPFNATAAQRLINAGAVIVGKANLDEFAMGSSTEHSAFGPTKNPCDPNRVPGGSSGGSAAAVGSGMVPVALGSDTGGSIRQPAAFCGAVGFKPTYGRVSRWGLVAFASSLDQIGPIATDVRDAALVTEVIAGTDAHDGTCADRPAPDLTTELETPVAGLRVGLVSHAAAQGNHAGVTEAVRRAADRLADAGAEIVDVDLPLTDHAIAAYYIVAPAEASSNLSRFDGVRYGRRADLGPADDLRELYVRSRTEGFGPEVRRRIMLGTYVLSSGYHDRYYARALRVRRRIKQDYDRALASGGGCHALLTPTTPGPAFGLGEKLDDPLALYLEDVYTVGVSLAGLPAITLPGGRVDEGGSPLPVGVQLVGHAFDESGLLRVARTLEKALGTVPA